MTVADVSPVVETELARLRAENVRLRNLLKMTPEQAAAAAPGARGLLRGAAGDGA